MTTPNDSNPKRQRDRAGASLPARAGPIPRSPPRGTYPRLRPYGKPHPNTQPRTNSQPENPSAPLNHPTRPESGSGTGPEQALEAIKPSPRAQRESSFSPELTCARRTDPAEPSPIIQPNSAPTPSVRLKRFREPWAKTSGNEIPRHRFRPRWPGESSTWRPSRMEAAA